MKLVDNVDNEFIFIGQDPHSSSSFGNKYLPVVVLGVKKKKKIEILRTG